MARIVKKEPGSRVRSQIEGSETRNYTQQGATERRVLRSRYLAVKNLISDEREDISRVNSDKFKSIISEVESLHNLVQKPREQVADAEALLDIANTLVTSVKSQNSGGVTPSDFITGLLKIFGENRGVNDENNQISVSWRKVGLSVSHIFKTTPGCCTMLGPMDTELKQRKVTVHRKRVRPTETARPEEVDDISAEQKTDTDKNMSIMFNILRKKKQVGLENLVLNRISFSQTVENIFALSFLVKDGRAEMSVDDNGCQLVSPRNAPAANAVASGEASYNHFVFRFDFKDWKLMKDYVLEGDEVMPHRTTTNDSGNSQANNPGETQALPTTPIRKLCRNRGLVMPEQVAVNQPDNDDCAEKASPKRSKRLQY